jgi:hypothetical protein
MSEINDIIDETMRGLLILVKEMKGNQTTAGSQTLATQIESLCLVIRTLRETAML